MKDGLLVLQSLAKAIYRDNLTKFLYRNWTVPLHDLNDFLNRKTLSQ